jgi:hypothetical protein
MIMKSRLAALACIMVASSALAPLVLCPAGGCSGTFTFQQWTGP